MSVEGELVVAVVLDVDSNIEEVVGVLYLDVELNLSRVLEPLLEANGHLDGVGAGRGRVEVEQGFIVGPVQ